MILAYTSPNSPYSPSPPRVKLGGHLGGSYPLPPNGLHLAILHAVNINPFAAPYFV